MASATLVMSIVASGPITNETASEVLVNSISGCQKMLDSNLLELGKIMMDQQSSLGVIEKKKFCKYGRKRQVVGRGYTINHRDITVDKVII